MEFYKVVPLRGNSSDTADVSADVATVNSAKCPAYVTPDVQPLGAA
jgi:hypothetical protein